MSSGLHSGIGELVGSALHEYQLVRRGRIRALGIAPWGIVDNREDLKGKDFSGPIPYQTMADPLSKGSVLNACHTHFLLVDNGTESKWGNEIKVGWPHKLLPSHTSEFYSKVSFGGYPGLSFDGSWSPLLFVRDSPTAESPWYA